MISPREPIVTIGLDDEVVALLRTRLDHPVRAYSAVPRIEIRSGRTFVESQRVAGKMVEAAGVVWHGYFDDAADARRALALSSTPTFPDIRATLPLDDRFVSLAMATRVDRVEEPRAVLRAGEAIEVTARSVAKWGHRHCGEGKALIADHFTAEELTIVEPFVAGTSERILLIGDAVWQLRYESEDWRKNVRSTVAVVDPLSGRLVARARRIADALALPMVGVDFIVRDDDAVLLEVNAYPGMEDAPGAPAAFVEGVASWAVNLESFKQASLARWNSATNEYRGTPPELRAMERFDEAAMGLVREGVLPHRSFQLLLLESFGDFTSYELSVEPGECLIGRLRICRTQDLEAIRRAPTLAYRGLQPTIERSVRAIAEADARSWLQRAESLRPAALAPTTALVADGTRCELRFGDPITHLTASCQWEAAPESWRELMRFAEDFKGMVDARP